jgi:hypothetical protein
MHKCSGCSISGYNSKYIFKFGGKTDKFQPCNHIEYFIIEENVWQDVILSN